MSAEPTVETAGRQHGTVAKYVMDKCRCPDCTEATRLNNNRRRRQIAYGRWEPYVDAEPARRHIRGLMAAGMGAPQIARTAGCTRNLIDSLIYGMPHRNRPPARRLRPENAALLLAVDLILAPGATVEPTGTRRRLQALSAGGWSQRQLAARLGLDRSSVQDIMHGGAVRASTVTAVLRLYGELWREDPRGHGVSENAFALARRHARASNWAPVGAWDDDTIDNPTAHPEWTGACGTPSGYNAHYDYRILPPCPPCREARAEKRRAGLQPAAAGPAVPTTNTPED